MLLISCQDIEEVERPKDLIPEQKMVEILTDLSLINSAKNYNKRLLEQTGLKPDEFLYQKHSIDSLRLARSTRFYASKSAQIERIYQKVQENLEVMRVDLELIREEEERVKDSIKLLERANDSLQVDPGVFEEVMDSLGRVREYSREYQN